MDKIQLIADRLTDLLKENYGSNRSFFLLSKRPVIARCKQWEDFKSLSTGAEIVFFNVNEQVNTIQTYALKDGLVLTCCYDFAKGSENFEKLLKIWMSSELDITEDRIFKGFLAPE